MQNKKYYSGNYQEFYYEAEKVIDQPFEVELNVHIEDIGNYVAILDFGFRGDKGFQLVGYRTWENDIEIDMSSESKHVQNCFKHLLEEVENEHIYHNEHYAKELQKQAFRDWKE